MNFRRSPRARKFLVRVFEGHLLRGVGRDRLLEAILMVMADTGFARASEARWFWVLDLADRSKKYPAVQFRAVYVGVEAAKRNPVFPNVLLATNLPQGTKVAVVEVTPPKRKR